MVQDGSSSHGFRQIYHWLRLCDNVDPRLNSSQELS